MATCFSACHQFCRTAGLRDVHIAELHARVVKLEENYQKVQRVTKLKKRPEFISATPRLRVILVTTLSIGLSSRSRLHCDAADKNACEMFHC
jgi:hypothetical protein